MESCQSMQSEIGTAKTLKEKVQDLPLLCVEAICNFTPTFNLFRLYSQYVPMPGAFWNYALEAAIKKRLPLSIDIEFMAYVKGASIAVFDATGTKIATVKQPEAFRFSPLLEFIETATLLGHASYEMPHFHRFSAGQLYVRHGAAVLSHLPNITALSLLVCESVVVPLDTRDLVAPNVKHLLPQLESLVIKRSIDSHVGPDQNLCSFLCALPIHEMSRLRRFHFPITPFRFALEQTNSGDSSALPIFSGLTSLGIWQFNYWNDAAGRLDVLRCVSTCYSQLTVLSIFVTGEFKPYLDAFRTLPNLNTLGMMLIMMHLQFNGLTFDGSNPIKSVLDFRVMFRELSYEQDILKIATFFPSVNAVAIRSFCAANSLQLATSLFGARQFFPAAAKLACFYRRYEYDLPVYYLSPAGAYIYRPLTQFLANPRLPETVDLSQVDDKLLQFTSGLLTAVFCTMQSNSIKILLMRGPLHWEDEDLTRLRSHLVLNGDDAKLVAWKNPDLRSRNFPRYFQLLKILGTKKSGSLKGEQFTIRVFGASNFLIKLLMLLIINV